MHLDFLYDLLGQYGVYAVFILVMIEGDITLLIAGVMAQSGFFGAAQFFVGDVGRNTRGRGQ